MATIVVGPRYLETKQLENSYIERDLALANEDVKQVQRDRVLSHLRRFHKAQNLRFFSLPGAWWAFENQVAKHYPDAKFVGLERNYEIMRHGVPFMPGTNRHKVIQPIRDGIINGYKSSNSVILWCHAETFITFTRREKAAGEGKFKNRWNAAWRDDYKKWTAAWWDFSAPISHETTTSLLKTETHLDENRLAAPVSITLMPARETEEYTNLINTVVPDIEDPMKKRVEFLHRWINHHNRLRTMEIVKYFVYQSAAGCPMLLINTMFRTKS